MVSKDPCSPNMQKYQERGGAEQEGYHKNLREALKGI